MEPGDRRPLWNKRTYSFRTRSSFLVSAFWSGGKSDDDADERSHQCDDEHGQGCDIGQAGYPFLDYSFFIVSVNARPFLFDCVYGRR